MTSSFLFPQFPSSHNSSLILSQHQLVSVSLCLPACWHHVFSLSGSQKHVIMCSQTLLLIGCLNVQIEPLPLFKLARRETSDISCAVRESENERLGSSKATKNKRKFTKSWNLFCEEMKMQKRCAFRPPVYPSRCVLWCWTWVAKGFEFTPQCLFPPQLLLLSYVLHRHWFSWASALLYHIYHGFWGLSSIIFS